RLGLRRGAGGKGDGRRQKIDDLRLDLRRLGSAGGGKGGERQGNVAPVFAGSLRNLGAADQLQLRFAIFFSYVLAASVQPRVIGRGPARAGDAIVQDKPDFANLRGLDIDGDIL